MQLGFMVVVLELPNNGPSEQEGDSLYAQYVLLIKTESSIWAETLQWGIFSKEWPTK